MKNVKLFLFDLDGTLYLGNRLFDFTPKLLEEIRKKGALPLFMTNNSSKSVRAYVEKLKKMGISATEEDFITSSQATVHYLKTHYPTARLYVCGTESFRQELREAGFVVTEETKDADCVVMGFDTELTFQKLWDVSFLLCTRDVPYLATNPDLVCPTEFGSVPDCGSMCEMIFQATGKRPVVIGKPEGLMPRLAMEKTGVSAEHTLVVGDRLYTDIRCGIRAGAATALVLSGETTREQVEQSAEKPDFVLKDAGEILSLL